MGESPRGAARGCAERPHAPGPAHGPRPGGGPAPDAELPVPAWTEEWEEDDEPDESAFLGDVPDDEALPGLTDVDEPALDDGGDLGPVTDDEPLPELADEEPPLADDPLDLDTDESSGLPVLPVTATVRAEGAGFGARSVRSRVDLGAPGNRWIGAPFVGVRALALEFPGGARLAAAVAGEAGQPEELVLGTELLTGRFLLRP